MSGEGEWRANPTARLAWRCSHGEWSDVVSSMTTSPAERSAACGPACERSLRPSGTTSNSSWWSGSARCAQTLSRLSPDSAQRMWHAAPGRTASAPRFGGWGPAGSHIVEATNGQPSGARRRSTSGRRSSGKCSASKPPGARPTILFNEPAERSHGYLDELKWDRAPSFWVAMTKPSPNPPGLAVTGARYSPNDDVCHRPVNQADGGDTQG